MSDLILDSTDSLADLDRESLTMAVGELLEQYGWQTTLALDVVGVDADRIATRAGKRRLLRTVPADAGPMTASMVTAAINAIEKTDATGLFLVSVADVTDAAQATAESRDDVVLVDIETTAALRERLSAICGLSFSRETPPDTTEAERGASQDMVEAAVADVDEAVDESGRERRPDESTSVDTSDTTDADVSDSVRAAERRPSLDELLTQGAQAAVALEEQLATASDSGLATADSPPAPQTEGGASPDVVEAAVADVDHESDSSQANAPDDQRPASVNTTDDEISESVRGTERRIVLGELLLQGLLLLGLLVCLTYVVFRLGQVLL